MMDKEYLVLSEIERDKKLTQRELSQRLGISLGSINILLKKMVKDGLIKVNQIPSSRVAYMLTPKGIAEKITKTVNYVKYHYNSINETKVKMVNAIQSIIQKHPNSQILLTENDLSQFVKTSVDEIHETQRIKMLANLVKDQTVLVADEDLYLSLKQQNYNVINLIEEMLG